MISPKGSVTDPKEIEMYKLIDKEFQIITLRKLSELRENSDNLTTSEK